MPKDTFFNLPEEKRLLIESAATDEFGEYGFDNASINRIVAAAGIAKGSFYQYFEDKVDLFKHMITKFGEQKLVYLSPVMQNPFEHDFFTLLEELYRSGLAFARDNPKAGKIGFEIFKNQTTPVFEEIYQDTRRQAGPFFESLLDQAISRGEVDPGIDKGFIIHLLIHLQAASFDYYFQTLKAGDVDLIGWTDDVMPTVNLMINFIKNGIQLQKQGVLTNDQS